MTETLKAEDTASGVADAASPSATPQDMGEPLVVVEGLVKHYGPIRAVDGINFTARRGDVLGFLGPNGAGKTTAMRLLTGFLEPDAGRVRIGGHDLATSALAARRRVGYLPENAPAYGEMTADGFLDFVAHARGVVDRPYAIEKVVDMTGLGKVRHQPIETLSKGFKRRVGLAQALIHDPEVLILDEPTDGLDPNQKALVQDLIAGLSASKCIILSTHILDEVERISNRAMIISQGKILVDSTPKALMAQAPGHNVVRLDLGAPNDEWVARVEAAAWSGRVESPSPGIYDVVPADGGNHLAELLTLSEGLGVRSVELREGRLDEIFRSMSKGVAA